MEDYRYTAYFQGSQKGDPMIYVYGAIGWLVSMVVTLLFISVGKEEEPRR